MAGKPYHSNACPLHPWCAETKSLVNAEVFEEFPGERISKPVWSENYSGHSLGLQDKAEGDVAGSEKFTGLKSAVFPASAKQPTENHASELATTKS